MVSSFQGGGRKTYNRVFCFDVPLTWPTCSGKAQVNYRLVGGIARRLSRGTLKPQLNVETVTRRRADDVLLFVPCLVTGLTLMEGLSEG
ncbi:hypothetical protein E2C01_001684 [Portunus trituberculatus]|uniref:Uncharacterized protein n=1 Tax=Portunus trituberculatus TaxID=210409 RepID=A0A5B7CJW7_PORTR|nr:hypothetical protein [Portunus trituberculatus]